MARARLRFTSFPVPVVFQRWLTSKSSRAAALWRSIAVLLGLALSPLPGCAPEVATETADPNYATKHFLYVAYSGVQYLSVLEIDKTAGDLTDTSQDIFLGYTPSQVLAHPTQPYVYVSSDSANLVAVYRIDPPTGALTLIGQWTHTGEGLRRMALDAAGNYLQIGNAVGGSISFRSKRVDLNTGSLADFGGSSTSISSAHGAFVAMNARGCLYVGLSETSEIYGIAINAASGVIDSIDTASPPVFSASGPTLGTATSDILYVMGGSSPYAVDTYQLSPTNCDITGSSNLAVADNTGSLLRHPTLPVLYVGTTIDTSLTAYSLDGSQAPTSQLGGKWVDIDAMDMVLGPGNQRLYVMSFGMQNISVLGVDPATGVFTTRVDFPLGDNPISATRKSF